MCPKSTSMRRHTATRSRGNLQLPYRSSGSYSCHSMAYSTARRNRHRRHFHYAFNQYPHVDGLARTCPVRRSAGTYVSKYWHDSLGPWQRLLPWARCACPLVPLVPQTWALIIFLVFLGGLDSRYLPIQSSVRHVFCSWNRGAGWWDCKSPGSPTLPTNPRARTP